MDRGADDFSVSGDEHAMASAASAFEVIIGAVPVKHDLNPYLALLHVYGTLVLVGQVGAIAEPNTISMILGRRRVAVSLIGSIRETREMLELCGHMKILPECEMINMDEINEALECME